MLNDGVNPRISIANDFEYVDINNLNNFILKIILKKVVVQRKLLKS